MYLTHYSPFEDIVSNLWGASGIPAVAAESGYDFAPSVDVVEKNDKWLFHFDVPGTERDNIHISVDANHLVVSGERHEDTKKEDAGYTYSERVHGKFERRFALPENTDPDSIDANIDNGVLTITVGKTAEIQPRQIPVK